MSARNLRKLAVLFESGIRCDTITPDMDLDAGALQLSRGRQIVHLDVLFDADTVHLKLFDSGSVMGRGAYCNFRTPLAEVEIARERGYFARSVTWVEAQFARGFGAPGEGGLR